MDKKGPHSLLFQPIRVGPLELKNRVVMSGTARRSLEMCLDPGTAPGVDEAYIARAAARARGGVGLIILEDNDVDTRTGGITGYATASPGQIAIDRDLFIPAMKELTATVHAFGAKIAANLRHLGNIAIPEDGRPALSASAGPNPFGPSRFGHPVGPDSVEASHEQIAQLQGAFADAAYRAKRAGFDAVHVAGHHGFLINQFLSARTNRRTDGYGGSIENRLRFAIEMVERMRARVGRDMAILFAIPGDELVPGGLGIEESKVMAAALERAGVDAIHVAPGILFPWPNGHRAIPPMGSPDGLFVHLAHEIKKVVKIPVIANGRIKDPAAAAQIVREGKADLVSLSRALLADPDWPIKVLRGQDEDIIPCIGCNFCLDANQAKLSSRCTVNPQWGREKFEITLAPRRKSVIIVGGGPAGLQAAIIAARRGHDVRLFEKEAELGGQLRIAHVPPGKAEIKPFTDYLVRQVTKLGVHIETGSTAGVDTIKRLSPDAVIVATGAVPIALNDKGPSRIPVVAAWDVLMGTASVGHKVVIAGGGATGCEVAEHLLAQGKDVTIVERGFELARDMNPLGEGVRHFMIERLHRQGVKFLLLSNCLGVNGDGVVVKDETGKALSLDADTLVTSFGVEPNRGFEEAELNRLVPEVYVVGDCVKPGNLLDATWSAALVAQRI